MELAPYSLAKKVDSGLDKGKVKIKDKTRVRVRQNAWQARIACKCIKQTDVALTIFKTIYLSHSTPGAFLNNQRWVAHELAHVRQFMKHGNFRFICMYILESLRKGYLKNKWEVEARAQEVDCDILQEFYFEYQD